MYAELQAGSQGFYSRVDSSFLIQEGVVECLPVCKGETHELEKAFKVNVSNPNPNPNPNPLKFQDNNV